MTDNVGLAVFIIGGTLGVLSILTTALRCYTRVFIVKSFGLDDWFMLLALALYIVFLGWGIRGKTIDFGKPTDEIPFTDIAPALEAFYFSELFFILTVFVLKLSLIAFMLRIIKERAQIIAVYVMLVIIVVLSVIFFFMAVFQCRPIDKYWNILAPGTCFDSTTVLGISLTHGIVIAATDFSMAILPLFIVRKLQMSRFMKFSVAALMGMGSIAGISSVIRLPYIKSLVENNGNFFVATSQLAIVSCIEPGLGIIIGSASTLRPLFGKIFGKSLIGSSFTGKSRSKNPTNPQSHRSQSRVTTLISRNKEADSDLEHGHRLDSLDSLDADFRPSSSPDSKGFGTIMTCEGGVGNNRDPNGSQEALTPGVVGYASGQGAGRRPHTTTGIYKGTTVERTVEFTPRD